MADTIEQLAASVAERLGARIRASRIDLGELTLEIEPAVLRESCFILRDDPDLAFEILIDLCGVDYSGYGRDEWQTTDEAPGGGFSRGVEPCAAGRMGPLREELSVEQPVSGQRFAAVYHLLSVSHNRRIRLRCFAPDDDLPVIDSVTDIWNSANWYEREAFDLFGIIFDGHPDLRRILTDYGFIGHPFRKDFPLSGNVEVRYDPERRRVVYEPVSIEPRVLVPRVIREEVRRRGQDPAGEGQDAEASG